MIRRLTTEEFIERAKSVHGDKYDYSVVEYKSAHEKVIIICPEHGAFEQTPNSHLRPCGCPKCGYVSSAERNKSDSAEFVDKAKTVHGNSYDYSKVEYIDARTKVKIICLTHGEFWQTPNHHLQGCGCPKCGLESMVRKQTLPAEEFVGRAKAKHGDKYDYSNVKYVNANTKVKIICPEHGEFEQTPSMHLSGQGCQKCGREKLSDLYRCSKKKFVDKAKMIHGDKYNYSKVEYINAHTKVCIICSEHGEFYQRPEKHLRGQGCPKCGVYQQHLTKKEKGSYSTSQSEEELYRLLVAQFGKNDVLRQYTDDRYPFPCDFYIKFQDLFIELNGYWTHGDYFFDFRDDWGEIGDWYIEDKLENNPQYRVALNTRVKRDPLKLHIAEKNGLNYLVFWDWDLSDAKEWLATQ